MRQCAERRSTLSPCPAVLGQIASTSSMKRMQGASRRARSKSRLISCSVAPLSDLKSSVALHASHANGPVPTNVITNLDLPVPGGPHTSIPFRISVSISISISISIGISISICISISMSMSRSRSISFIGIK